MYVIITSLPILSDYLFQWPIPADHEFIITTDNRYSEICDDKVMWVDYVIFFSLFFIQNSTDTFS